MPEPSDSRLEIFLLQTAVAIAAVVPIVTGLAGVLGGPSVFAHDTVSVTLDSHMRYLSGLLLGIGLAFWTFVPRITEVSVQVRILTGIVVIGGLCRLLSLVLQGVPSSGMLFGLFMELAVTPALCWWQGRLAHTAR